MARIKSDYDVTPIAERLKKYLDAIGLNSSRFEKKCGLYNGFVKDMDSKITFESLAKIGSNCPDLNLGWLFSGVGEMRLGQNEDKSQEISHREKEEFRTEIHTTNNTMGGDIKVGEISELREVIADLRKDKERLQSENDYLRAKKDEIWEMFKNVIDRKPMNG